MYKKNYLFALACAAALVGCGEGNKDAEKKNEAAQVEAPTAAAPAEHKAAVAPEANTPAATDGKKEEPKTEPSAPATPENKEGEGEGKGKE